MSRRTSIYFDEELHQALRLKAAVLGESVSDLVNEAVKAPRTSPRSMLALVNRRWRLSR